MLDFLNRPTSVSHECCFSSDVGGGTTVELCISPRNWVNRWARTAGGPCRGREVQQGRAAAAVAAAVEAAHFGLNQACR